jgi:hypothetical protein
MVDMSTISIDQSRQVIDPSTSYDRFEVRMQDVKLTTQDELICRLFDIVHFLVKKTDIGMTKIKFHLSVISLQMTRRQYLGFLSAAKLYETQPSGLPHTRCRHCYPSAQRRCHLRLTSGSIA